MTKHVIGAALNDSASAKQFQLTSVASFVTRAVIASSLTMGLTLAIAPSAYAEQAVAPVSQTDVVTQSFQLAAGSLESVLNKFGREAKILLAFPTAITQGLQSKGLSGQFTREQALAELLAGTEIIAVRNGDNSYILQQQAQQSGNDVTLPTVSVVGENLNSANTLVDSYAGGLVATGGRLGILGEQDAANVPFNVISYTSKLIENQQALTIADVLDNDASVQRGFGYGNYAEKFLVRGFALDGDAISYGGLYGVLPRQVVATNLAERVELFKGSNAFLNGVSPGGSGIGGAINIEPKRAGDKPLTRISLDYSMDSQIGLAADVSRRFGQNEQFGVRVNLLNRDGDTAIDDESRRTKLASVALDYQGDKTQSSLDIGHMKQSVSGGRSVVYTGGSLTSIPDAPSADTNYAPSWAGTDLENTFAMLRSEYAFNDDWNTYAAIGANKTKEFGDYSSPTVDDAAGNATGLRLSVPYESKAFSHLVGLRGQFDTGEVSHKLNMGYSGFYQKTSTAYTMSWPTYTTNIYNPTNPAYPATVFFDGDMNDPNVRSRTRMSGVSLSDSIGLFDERVLLTLGVRYQDITVKGYTYGGDLDTTYEDHATSPVYGIVVKPWQHVSLYANHIEALQQGPSAPNSAANPGQVFAPYQSEQNEVGIKIDYDTIGGSLAVFEISKPEGYTNTNNVYGIFGEQRNRGVELSVYGAPTESVRLNSSASWLNPELQKTQNGSNDGNDAVGVSEYRVVLGGEWDLPMVNGLTVLGKVIHNGSQYADAANTLKLDSWTRLDLGMSYSMKMGKQQVMWRANINNVTDENYWASATGGYLTQGNPREVKLSVSTDF
ncbi:hypothetical protein A9Q78_00675 [Methylophaga sp. 41_12_T18]|nr:hypothetical protein A9Q78_00675 [Methylophaga sp. 41_12_T18]